MVKCWIIQEVTAVGRDSDSDSLMKYGIGKIDLFGRHIHFKIDLCVVS